MAKQYRVLRKIATRPIVANGFDQYDLPIDYDYEAIGFRINASLQVTVLATAVRAEAPLQLLPRIEVIADGKNTIFSAPAWAASLGNYLRRAKDSGSRAVTPPSGVAVATYAVEANCIVDFAQPDGIRPKDTSFRSTDLSLFQTRLTFGSPGDCFVGGTVAFSGTPTVDIYALNTVEERGADGQFIDAPLGLTKTSYQEAAILASNTQYEIDLPAGNLIRSVMLRTEGDPTAGEPSALILNNMILQNGIDVRHNLQAANVRGLNNLQYGQLTAGYYVADFMTQGSGGNNLLGNLWDVTGRSQPKAVLDVVGGGSRKVQVVTKEIILGIPS